MGVWGWCWWRERRNQGCLFGLGLQQLVSCGIFFVPIETEMLVEEQFWVSSAVSPYVPHGVLRWRCLWDLQVGVCSWQLEVHFFVSPVLKDKHFNNCLRLDYTFYNASLEGLGLLKDLSMPWIHPNFCISPPPGSLISYLLNTYTTTWLLRPSCLAPEWTSLRDLAVKQLFAEIVPHPSGEGMSVSPHSHQHGEILFAYFIDGDTFQLVLQRYPFNQQTYSMCITTHIEALTSARNYTEILGCRSHCTPGTVLLWRHGTSCNPHSIMTRCSLSSSLVF